MPFFMKVTLHEQGEQKMKLIVGIDVSKDKFDCLWLKDSVVLTGKSKALPNTPKGFEELRAWLIKHVSAELADIHVIMEATGIYHESLAYALYGFGVNVSVVNPAFVRNYAKSLGARHKTDKQDSWVIARYGASRALDYWKPEPEEIRELKAMLSRLAALEMDLQRELNRLEKTHCSSGASARVLDSIQTMVQHLRDEKQKLESDIDNHINRHPDLKVDRDILLSVPAIGNVLSRELLALLRSREFTYAGQASAFVGLIPRLNESGNFKGRTTLCKNGSNRLRAKLYMAAIVAIRHNPDIKAQYRRLLAAGKTKMQALGAAMRKLVQICFGVLKHQCEYRPQITT